METISFNSFFWKNIGQKSYDHSIILLKWNPIVVRQFFIRIILSIPLGIMHDYL